MSPGPAYSQEHERLRNRRIEEVIRQNEVQFNDLLNSALRPPCLVSELPMSARVGARGFVTDASVSGFGGPVVGGGSIYSPVYFDGATWRVG